MTDNTPSGETRKISVDSELDTEATPNIGANTNSSSKFSSIDSNTNLDLELENGSTSNNGEENALGKDTQPGEQKDTAVKSFSRTPSKNRIISQAEVESNMSSVSTRVFDCFFQIFFFSTTLA